MQYLLFSCIAASRLVVEHTHPAQTCPARRCRWIVWLCLIVFFAHNHHDISGLEVWGASFACIIRMNFSSLEWRLERDGLRDTQKHHQCSCFFFQGRVFDCICCSLKPSVSGDSFDVKSDLTDFKGFCVSMGFQHVWDFDSWNDVMVLYFCWGWFPGHLSQRANWTKDKAHADLEADPEGYAYVALAVVGLFFTVFFTTWTAI